MTQKSLKIILPALAFSASLAGCTSSFFGSLLPANSPSGTSAAEGTPSPGPTAQVKVPVSIAINPSSLVILQQTQQALSATVQYADGTFDGAAVWSSSDNTIVSVNATTGTVTGVKPGVASIIATSTLDSSKRSIITVTVQPAAVSDAFVSISPATATIPVHTTVQLSGYLQTSTGATNTNYTWASSNQAIAVVTGGLVSGVAPGTASITATSIQNPSVQGSATIVVTAQ